MRVEHPLHGYRSAYALRHRLELAANQAGNDGDPYQVTRSSMRIGNVEIRPLGGGLGCLLMILFSIVASVVLTIAVNLIF